MEIKIAELKDAAEIAAMIITEFPYTAADPERAAARISNPKFQLFKAIENKKILGFIEIEFLENGLARINGLSVRTEQRNKGIGKKILDFAIQFMKKRGVKRIMLLVKQENEAAKNLYSDAGFKFVGLYHSALDNSTVEEMELDLNTEKPSYVS